MAQTPVQYLFVSNRDVIVTSTLGYSIEFKRGQPTHVPRSMHREVIERGILPVDEAGEVNVAKMNEVVEEAEKGPRIVLAPETREDRVEAIEKVLAAIVKRNNSNDFTAGGTPSAASVTQALGWKVDQREVKDVWTQFRQKGKE